MFNKAKFFTLLLTLAIASLSTSATLAASIAKCDLNSNGAIDHGIETENLKNCYNSLLKNSAERTPPNAISHVSPPLEPDYASLGNANALIDGATKTKNSTTKSLFFVRRSFNDIDLLEDIGEQLPSKGALFSYTRDFESDASILAANGAIYLPFIIEPNSSDPNNHPTDTNAVPYRTGFVLGTSFDVIDDNTKTKKIQDTLGVYAGFQQGWAGGRFVDANVFQVGASYFTDSDLKSSIIEADAHWYPVSSALKTNVPQTLLNGIVQYQTRLSFDGEVARTLDPGEKENLSKEQDIVAGGLTVGLDLWLGPAYNPAKPDHDTALVHIYAAWENLWGELGDKDHADFLLAGLEWFLDDDKHFTLKLEYQNGEQPIIGSDKNLFLAGLGVKY